MRSEQAAAALLCVPLRSPLWQVGPAALCPPPSCHTSSPLPRAPCLPQCVKGNCAQVSRTPGCAACNRDGTCTRCANAGNGERRFVVPANALYINAPAGGGPDAVCLTLPELQAEARTFTGRALAIPPSCVEVTTDFKCARCADRATLTADNRVRTHGTRWAGGRHWSGWARRAGSEQRMLHALRTVVHRACPRHPTPPFPSGPGSGPQCVYRGNRCKATLGWYQYCVKCSANGRRCLTCTPGRSPLNGECSLACKRLFGISCAACTATACTRIDPAYASGRR